MARRSSIRHQAASTDSLAGMEFPEIHGAPSLTRRDFARGLLAVAGIALLGPLTGCVDQHPERAAGDDELRLIATSPAVADMCNVLNLDLVGVCDTTSSIPDRYADLPKVGMAMSPDLEKIVPLHADYVIAPSTLREDQQPKFAQAGVKSIFVDMSSVDGLYASSDYLGTKFGKEQEAAAARSGFQGTVQTFQASYANRTKPSVLVLMGVPGGTYIVATPKSYVGNLVALAGGQNIYADATDQFVNANTEDMLARDPDIILRTSHALQDEVRQMFADEFATNDTWKHFRAVQERRVYDLEYSLFGMSARFNWPDALTTLGPMLYGTGTGSDGTEVTTSSGEYSGNDKGTGQTINQGANQSSESLIAEASSQQANS